MSNLIENIESAMTSDDLSKNQKNAQAGKIKSEYANADQKGKELVDNIFIALCGYSLETLINEEE